MRAARSRSGCGKRWGSDGRTGDEVTQPGAILKGYCPDSRRCTLPVPCSHQCSRLQSAEIAEELRANAARAAGRKPHTHMEATTTREEPRVDDDQHHEHDTADEEQNATGHGECKIDGCTEPAAANAGPYAKLCPAHRDQAKQQRATVRRPRRLPKRAAAAKRTVKPPPARDEWQRIPPVEAAGPPRPDRQGSRDRDGEGRTAGARDGVRGARRRIREGHGLR